MNFKNGKNLEYLYYSVIDIGNEEGYTAYVDVTEVFMRDP